VDGKLYETKTPADIPGKKWVFDRPFFILLDLAIGGDWPGSPDETTIFPQEMLVDYVRVYADIRYDSDFRSPWPLFPPI
jgi:beta-glucanase (GH16 family)